MSNIRVIAGLGNPGQKYARTRHNAGFMVIDALSELHGIPLNRGGKNNVWGEGELGGRHVMLLKPQLYMNKSGQAMKALLGKKGTLPSEILVIYDDVNIDMGRIRLREKGSSGGHNGVSSIIEVFGSNEFPRLRLGVGRSEGNGNMVGHVLGHFSKSEWGVWVDVVKAACDAVLVSTTSSVSDAMNKFNSNR